MGTVLFVWLVALFGNIFSDSGDIVTWETLWRAVRWAAGVWVGVSVVLAYLFRTPGFWSNL